MAIKSAKPFLENLTEEQKRLGSRIFDLIVGRVLKRVYLSLDESGKKNMETIFLSDDSKEKEKFVKKYAPDFKEIFKEEAGEINGEITEEILKKTTT